MESSSMVLSEEVQRSEHCRLVCQLNKDDPTRERQELQLATAPGWMVIDGTIAAVHFQYEGCDRLFWPVRHSAREAGWAVAKASCRSQG